MSRIIIGALSGAAMSDRRAQCRATWMADAAAVGCDAVFLLGSERGPELNGDELHLPCPDAYWNLTQRTRWFCEWALSRDGWDYLFKCDDDTYVSIPRLLAYHTAGRDYIGAEWKEGVKYGSGGAGYFLSRRASEVVARQLRHVGGAEDRLVGRILRRHQIYLSVEPRFVPYATAGGDANRLSGGWPRADNDLITGHQPTPEAWLQAHAATGLTAYLARRSNSSSR